MVHLRNDGIGYLLPFLGENKELHRLSSGIHHIVEGIVLHRHHTETEHHLMGPFESGTKLRIEHTRANDTEIGSNQYIAQ